MTIKIKELTEYQPLQEQNRKSYYCSRCHKWYDESEVVSLKLRFYVMDKQGHRLHQMY